VAGARVLIALCAVLGAAPPGAAAAGAAPPPDAPAAAIRWGPYKDASVQMASDAPRLLVKMGERVLPLVPASGSSAPDARALPSGVTLTLAFATGECGSETIAGVPGAALARANLPALAAAGVDFIVSTGGQIGKFACASEQGMEEFLAHYRSPRFVGIDFDIEGERTAVELEALTRQIAAAEQRHPALRWSFTVPTFGGSDATHTGLNPLAAAVLAAARRNGVHDFVVNLMAMDYGTPSAAVCVLAGNACDMARSAVQAAENLHSDFGVPYAHIALTAMLGRNDTAGSVTSLDDIRAIARYARQRGLAGLHYWSLDRDNPCADTAARNDCSGMPYPPLAYTRAIAAAMGAR
jgi:chitinase